MGISGVSNDLRNIESAAKDGNYRAELAVKMLANSIKKYIGSYIAEMNGIDAVVFTAGIGENDANMRNLVCKDMDFFGISIDEDKNANAIGVASDISSDDAKVKTLVIPTNEEYMIALDTLKFCK